MWSVEFSKNPLDFVSNSSSFATDSSGLDKHNFGGNLKSSDIGWGRLGDQLMTEVLHLLALPEDAEVGIRPVAVEIGDGGGLAILNLINTRGNSLQLVDLKLERIVNDGVLASCSSA